MGLPNIFKPKKEEELIEVIGQKKTMPQPPLPPPFKAEVKEDNKEVLELLNVIINNQAVIYEEIKKSHQTAIVLSSEELNLVPEEDKEEYLALKENNPKKAEVMLAGYKATKKK